MPPRSPLSNPRAGLSPSILHLPTPLEPGAATAPSARQVRRYQTRNNRPRCLSAAHVFTPLPSLPSPVGSPGHPQPTPCCRAQVDAALPMPGRLSSLSETQFPTQSRCWKEPTSQISASVAQAAARAAAEHAVSKRAVPEAAAAASRDPRCIIGEKKKNNKPKPLSSSPLPTRPVTKTEQ